MIIIINKKQVNDSLTRPPFLLLGGMVILSLLSSSPLIAKECRVSIDIGHSKKRQGATSSVNIGEYQYNKRASIDLYYALLEEGMEPIFVNQEEKEISLIKRVQLAKSNGADIFVSMHHDSVKEQFLKTHKVNGEKAFYCDRFSGYGIFVSRKNKYFKKSLALANSIGAEIRAEGYHPSLHHSMKVKGENKHLFNKERGIYQYDNLIVLKKAPMPAVLIENGIILNRRDERLLGSSSYRKRFVSAIAKGIRFWCDD